MQVISNETKICGETFWFRFQLLSFSKQSVLSVCILFLEIFSVDLFTLDLKLKYFCKKNKMTVKKNIKNTTEKAN